MSDVIAVKVTRHQCPFCRQTWAKKMAAERHVDRCYRNPAARSCKTCALYQPSEDGDWLTGYPGCPEDCGARHDLAAGLRVHCADWEVVF